MTSGVDGPIDPEQYIRELLPQLQRPEITYFPIRHHSPACARHIASWIRVHRPASVLIEGPESFNSFVPALADDRCQLPVALYTNFVDTQNRLSLSADNSNAGTAERERREQPRFAAYYPLCDYSPELVALRSGLAVGARIQFADLEFAEKILHSHGVPPEGSSGASRTTRVDSLTEDPHLAYSEYTAELAHRLGCRDFNELWDHLFEAGHADEPTDEFIERLATFCAMSRLTFRTQQLHSDGTLAREDCMAAAIREELRTNRQAHRTGPVLVVTGGFHTVALPNVVNSENQRPTLPDFRSGETGTWLIPYSFDRLDALSGYGSGMPSPAFYDRLWKARSTRPDATNDDPDQAIGELILDACRLIRERHPLTSVSTPDAIAAIQMAKQLAQLRGHACPQREDVLDALRGCLVKGEMESDGQLLMTVVEQLLAGNRVGQVPPGTCVPPIVDDFRKLARHFRLPIETLQTRELPLDLYRKQQSRDISRLLHQLSSLHVPFARFVAGPDFAQGMELERMTEVWQLQWSPATDSGLIEAAVYGSSIAEAAGTLLREQIATLAVQPGEHSTEHAVSLLVSSCCMGLHSLSRDLLPVIQQVITADSQLPSLSRGLTQLVLLLESREPLEAQRLDGLPSVIAACYQRSCQLIRDAGRCPDSLVEDWLAAFAPLRELLATPLAQVSNRHDEQRMAVSLLDQTLWHQALRHILDQPPDETQAVIAGAAAGILYGNGQLSQRDLIQHVLGFLAGTQSPDSDACGVLRGLLAMSREVAWNVPEVLSALDDLFGRWDESTFLRALPDLRLAFSDFTPQETHRVAEAVALLYDDARADQRTRNGLAETDVQMGLELTKRVREALFRDGQIESNN